MHESVMRFVARMVEEHRLNRHAWRVLECGSLDVNGSVRALFDRTSYHGIDIRAGAGVDEVADANDLPFDDDSFDVVVSTEMLEHDRRPWRSIAEMCRVSRRYVIVTARGFDRRGAFPLHDYPQDVWRFSELGVRAMFEDAGVEVDTKRDPQHPGVFAIAKCDRAKG